MKQYFTNYKNWEDWQNGMWNPVASDNEQRLIELATECLKNPKQAMQSVVYSWLESTKVNLTNIGSNRKSWLGQAACCFQYGVPESLTRIAWNALNKKDKDNANQIAKEIIEKWESNYKS